MLCLYLGDSIELEVDESDFGSGAGVVHDCPALGARVDDDAEGGAAGDDCVAPHRVLDRERLFLVASAAVVGHLPNEPENISKII